MSSGSFVYLLVTVSGFRGQAAWTPALRRGGGKVPQRHVLWAPRLYFREVALLPHCISCGCAVTGIKSSAFNAKGSEIFLKLIPCPMQVFSTTCITSTL